MNAKRLLERYEALLAFINQRAGDPDESAFESLVGIAERADRDKRWLRQQRRIRRSKP